MFSGIACRRSLGATLLVLAVALVFPPKVDATRPDSEHDGPWAALFPETTVESGVFAGAVAAYSAGRPALALKRLARYVPGPAGSAIARLSPVEALLVARLLRLDGKPVRAAAVVKRVLAGKHAGKGSSEPGGSGRSRIRLGLRVFGPYLRLERARALAEAGEHKRAATVLWSLREDTDAGLWFEALQLQAECFSKSGKWLAAALAYEELADRARPSEMRAFFRLNGARCRLKRGQAGKAARSLRSAAVHDAGSAWDAEILAVFDGLRKRSDLHVRKLSVGELELRARGLMARLRGAEAAEAYRRLGAHPPKGDARGLSAGIGEARALLLLNRPEEALNVLRPLDAGRGALASRAQKQLHSALKRAGRFDLLAARLCTLAGFGRGCAPSARGRRTPERDALGRAAARALLAAGKYAQAERVLARSGGAGSFLAGYLALKADKIGTAVRVFTALRRNRTGTEAATYWLAVSYLKASDRSRYSELLATLVSDRTPGFYGLMALARLARGSAGARPKPVALYRKFRRASDDRLVSDLLSVGDSVESSVRLPFLRMAGLVRVGFFAEARRQLRWTLSCHARLGETKAKRPLSAIEALFTTPCGTRPTARSRSPGFKTLMAVPRTRRILRSAAGRLDEFGLLHRLGGAAGRGRPPMPRAEAVDRWAAAYGVRPSWIWAVMKVESAFDPLVVSWAGAKGLMQIMPHTARRIARALSGENRFGTHRLLDAEVSLRFGSWYLGQLYTKFNRQLALALAAYNGGPHNVTVWLRLKGDLPLDEFVEEIPFSETRRYVKKTLRHAVAYSIWTGDPILELVELQLKKETKSNIDF